MSLCERNSLRCRLSKVVSTCHPQLIFCNRWFTSSQRPVFLWRYTGQITAIQVCKVLLHTHKDGSMEARISRSLDSRWHFVVNSERIIFTTYCFSPFMYWNSCLLRNKLNWADNVNAIHSAQWREHDIAYYSKPFTPPIVQNSH